MKVLIVANGVPNGANSLDGIFEFDQAKALAAAGVDVTFFGIDLRSIRHLRRIGITKGIMDGIHWYKVSIPLGRIPLKCFCEIGRKALLYLYNNVFDSCRHPDIIHAHFTEQGYMATILSTKKSIPLVLTEHSSQIMSRPINSALFRIAQNAYASSSHIITVSSALSEKMKDEFGVETLVIPNIIDVDLFNNTQHIKHDGYNVVVVAGLINRKRVDKLMETVSILNPIIPDIHLHIVGDGPLRQQLEDKASCLSIKKCVKFYGALTRSDIAKVFAISDCFVLLSAAETFGVVYIEAMAAGLPVVATHCGGPDGLVNKENGILVDVDDVAQAAKAIEYIYKNRDNYDRESIRQYAKQNFSPQHVASQIINVYKSVLYNG